MLVLNEQKELIFESGELDIFYGDEFWELENNESLTYTESGRAFSFTINGHDPESPDWTPLQYTYSWDGNKLLQAER